MKKILAALLVTVAMTGTAIAGSNYTLSVSPPSDARVAAQSTAKVKVSPDKTAGYKMNLEYPTKLTITPPEGVRLAKTKLVAADAKLDKDSLEFNVAFTAETTGRKAFTGELKFAVCTENDCKPQVETIAFTVDVK